MPRHEWTCTELRAALARYKNGERWPEIAEDYGVSPDSVRQAVDYHLGVPSRRPVYYMKDEDKVIKAVALRNTSSKSWEALAAEVGYDTGGHNLYRACIRYCKRHNMSVRRGQSPKKEQS